MQRQLIDYIRRPETMDQQAIAHLRGLVEKYPYFHTARILLLQALHRSRDVSFDGELRASSPMIPNRQAIFRLIEERNYSLEEEHRKFGDAKASTNAGDRTENLIDLFLQGLPQEQPTDWPMPVDATQDYIGYLMQSTANETSSVDSPLLEGNDIIDDFLQNGPSRITIQRADDTPVETVKPQPQTEAQTPQNTDFLTETLAGIYIKQGKYENAVKILKQISLKNPQKSRYFADQLRFLDKLILNNKNKKQ